MTRRTNPTVDDPPAITDPGDEVRADADGECIIELTENGLLDRQAPYGRADVEDWHDVVAEDDESLVLHTNGHAVDDWASKRQLNVPRRELAGWFLAVARSIYGRAENNGHDPYSGRQPIVFDKRTFE
jgi:hypothetical protein